MALAVGESGHGLAPDLEGGFAVGDRFGCFGQDLMEGGLKLVQPRPLWLGRLFDALVDSHTTSISH